MIEPIVLVHGTFANVADGKPKWWLPESAFCKSLDAKLAQLGSNARCWAHVGLAIRPWERDEKDRVFAWTGDNLESERVRGGRALARLLTQIESDPTTAHYHVVSHSHGGNVVLHALQAMDTPAAKLGAVLSLGTPMLRFAHQRSLLQSSYLTTALYIVGMLAAAAFTPIAGEYQWLSIAAAVACALALFEEWLSSRPRVDRDPQAPYGSGRPHAFAFHKDEAITALKRTMEIAHAPREFLDQFFASQAPRAWKQPPSAESSQAALGPLERTAAFRLIQVVSGTGAPATAGAGFAVESGFGSPTTGASSKARWQREFYVVLQMTRGGGVIGFALIIGLLAASILVLIPWLVAVLVALGSGVVGWGMAAIKRWLVRIPGSWVMGRVVRSAALGADMGRFELVEDRPPGVTALEPLSDALQARMSACADSSAAQAGQALYAALGEGSAMKLSEYVKSRLTGDTLAHCQYYEEEEIHTAIAHHIANASAGAIK